jgi:peptidoglycan/LPS O-acetylase OafA/YrhL
MRNVAPLTSLRFFAALWVLLFHLRIHLGSPQPFVLERLLLAGPLAMTFFFVLSGFILVVASQDKEPWADLAGYAWRRFARIYPIYLTYLLLFWAVIGFSGNLGDRPFIAAVALGFTDLTLTNAWFPQGFLGGLWARRVLVAFCGGFLLRPIPAVTPARATVERSRNHNRTEMVSGICRLGSSTWQIPAHSGYRPRSSLLLLTDLPPP